ncbi:MAG: hypothetical protein HFH49_06225 [Lachnospiraceae bacterium]|nr:hypothetical protein [Lachnospiraceae bacterium]
MNLEEQLKTYQKLTCPMPEEEKISQTVHTAQQSFFAAWQDTMLSFDEFLWIQLKLIQKRWWILQFLLLCTAGTILASSWEESYIQRGMAVCSALFSILTIPEFWKNRSCQSMEIETAAYYSLRQIYAARMLLFGIADTLLLASFGGAAVLSLNVPAETLLVQFLLPMIVTSAICFGTLSSRRKLTESSALALSVLWSALWLLITLNEKVYAAVTLPIWIGILGISLLCWCLALKHTLKTCGDYWETRTT